MSAQPSPRENVQRGATMMLTAVFFVAILNVLVKTLAVRYPVTEIAFFRSLFGMIPTLAMVAVGGGPSVLRTQRPMGHVWRSMFSVAQMFLNFWAFHLMPLADAVAISYSTPLFVALLSGPLLGEKVGLRRAAVVVAGFVGVLIIVRPGVGALGWVGLVPVAGAASFAVAMLQVRQLSRTEHPLAIVFYFTVLTTVLSSLTLPFAWVTPTPRDLGWMLVAGLSAGVAQYFLTRAYTLAPASVVGTLNYATILWALLFGWILWGDAPGPPLLTGGAIIVCSGVYLLRSEAGARAASRR